MGQLCHLLLAAALVILVNGDLCPYEVCECSSFTIDCKNKGLSTLPTLKKGNFTQTRLEISNNNITSIADGQLPPGLVSFTSHNTPLAAIEDNAFNGSSSTLLTLDIQDSQFINFPWELMDLPHLTSLLWSGNPTTSWNPSVLATLGKTVESVTLDRAGMTHIPDLGHMTKLQSLYLYNNQITDSATGSLPDSLTFLRLGSNSLTEVPRAVSGLSRLTFLYLNGNKIHSVDSFTFPSSLQTLNLYYNQIENISSISFSQNTSELTSLYLNNNPLKHIANDAFTKLSKLISLYLYSTRLTRLPLALRSLTHLTSLNLDNIPTLTCTCEEAALVPWYNNLTSLTITPGSHCDGTHDVDFFLGRLAQNCPAP